jgi:transcriptional regulator with XRE-family HTH domain
MKERLLQLLDLEQLSPSKFADSIGVQRSSVSHVISGRNKPSYDFLQKTLKAFPGLNASWLMMGEGTMYEQMGRSMSGNLFDPAPDTPEELSPENIPVEEGEIHQSAPSEAPISEEAKAEIPEPASDTDLRAASEALGAASILGSKKIVQVMVIYADDTFRAFTPAH